MPVPLALRVTIISVSAATLLDTVIVIAVPFRSAVDDELPAVLVLALIAHL